MPDTLPIHTITTADRAEITRQATRLLDISLGRTTFDPTQQTLHYLILDRPSLVGFGPAFDREIEQYRDLERVVSQAADLETGERRGKWVGAFTATYRDGKLAGIAMVEDLAQLVAAERAKTPDERLSRLRGVRGMLKAVAS